MLRKKAQKSLQDLGERAMMVTSWPIEAPKVDDFCWSVVVHVYRTCWVETFLEESMSHLQGVSLAKKAVCEEKQLKSETMHRRRRRSSTIRESGWPRISELACFCWPLNRFGCSQELNMAMERFVSLLLFAVQRFYLRQRWRVRKQRAHLELTSSLTLIGSNGLWLSR